MCEEKLHNHTCKFTHGFRAKVKKESFVCIYKYIYFHFKPHIVYKFIYLNICILNQGLNLQEPKYRTLKQIN